MESGLLVAVAVCSCVMESGLPIAVAVLFCVWGWCCLLWELLGLWGCKARAALRARGAGAGAGACVRALSRGGTAIGDACVHECVM